MKNAWKALVKLKEKVKSSIYSLYMATTTIVLVVYSGVMSSTTAVFVLESMFGNGNLVLYAGILVGIVISSLGILLGVNMKNMSVSDPDYSSMRKFRLLLFITTVIGAPIIVSGNIEKDKLVSAYIESPELFAGKPKISTTQTDLYSLMVRNAERWKDRAIIRQRELSEAEEEANKKILEKWNLKVSKMTELKKEKNSLSYGLDAAVGFIINLFTLNMSKGDLKIAISILMFLAIGISVDGGLYMLYTGSKKTTREKLPPAKEKKDNAPAKVSPPTPPEDKKIIPMRLVENKTTIKSVDKDIDGIKKKIRKSVNILSKNGKKITIAGVAKSTDLSRPTVRKYINEALKNEELLSKSVNM